MWDNKDRQYMEMALDLATRGLGKTWPNPMVGAVIVKNGKIVGRGWHKRYGGPHAEIFALRDAGLSAQGATLYLNLEPCSHYGKTPPCANAVLASGIRRVVCAMRDPHDKVAGRGFRILREGGLRVETGLMRKEAMFLNRVFIKRVTKYRPYVINKVAMSMDGKIACANGSSRWISGKAGRIYAHRLRALADVIVVGMGTVIQDDPMLTIRHVTPFRKELPMRIILEGRRKIRKSLKMFRDAQGQSIVIASASSAKIMRVGSLVAPRWYIPGKDGLVDLDKLLEKLGQMKKSLVMVEGGAQTHAAFLGMNKRNQTILSDELHIVVAPKIIGNYHAPGPIGGIGATSPQKAIQASRIECESLGNDYLFKMYLGKGLV